MRYAGPGAPTAGTAIPPIPTRAVDRARWSARTLRGIPIVRAHGELGRQTVAPPARALAEARAARPGRLLLIVDLGEATFTDCSIPTPLCDAWYDCRARSGRLRIVYGNQTTHLVFRCTGLLDRFPVYASAQDVWEGRTADPGAADPAPALLRHGSGR